jgi:hypothetical protein
MRLFEFLKKVARERNSAAVRVCPIDFQQMAENRCFTCGVDRLDEKRFGGLVQAGSAVAGPRRAVRCLEIGATGTFGVLLGAGIPESS